MGYSLGQAQRVQRSTLSPDSEKAHGHARGNSIAVAANARRGGAVQPEMLGLSSERAMRRESVGRARFNEALTPLWALPSRFRGEVMFAIFCFHIKFIRTF